MQHVPLPITLLAQTTRRTLNNSHCAATLHLFSWSVSSPVETFSILSNIRNSNTGFAASVQIPDNRAFFSVRVAGVGLI
ncbi:hypothetical protein SDJN02_27581, partial [Cucurbita argyrosperma subsp. argyrosperma]